MGMWNRKRAGRSADRAYADALKKWRRQIRGRLALGILALASLGVVGILLTDIDIFFIGVVSGAVIATVIWMRDDPPPFIENWRMGRDGERWTEKELRPLERDGWWVRHDIESRYGNIDHVVTGPGGVFLLNSKNLWGSFAIKDGVLTCHHEIAPLSDYSMPGLERQMGGAAWGLEERLKPQLGWRVDVWPVVVVWAEFPERDGRLEKGKVAVVGGRRLREWLREQPIRLAERDRPAVAEAVAALPDALASPTPQEP
jgi:hypothetical protein